MAELLRVENLSAGYGEAQVVQGLSFALENGRSLALLGRNGVGKTTLIDTLIGVTTRFGGRIWLGGEDIAQLPPHARARRGVGWTPQERNIFRSLTVEENLTAVARPGAWTVKRIYGLFPRLEERRGNMGRQLSGGEQTRLQGTAGCPLSRSRGTENGSRPEARRKRQSRPVPWQSAAALCDHATSSDPRIPKLSVCDPCFSRYLTQDMRQDGFKLLIYPDR